MRERLRELPYLVGWEEADEIGTEETARAFGAAGKRGLGGAWCEKNVFFAARLSCCGNCWLVSKAEGT